MPNLKDIKSRIGSVKKTKQITSAMKLVSVSSSRIRMWRWLNVPRTLS